MVVVEQGQTKQTDTRICLHAVIEKESHVLIMVRQGQSKSGRPNRTHVRRAIWLVSTNSLVEVNEQKPVTAKDILIKKYLRLPIEF